MSKSREATKAPKNDGRGGSAPVAENEAKGIIKLYGMNPVDHEFATEVFERLFMRSLRLTTEEVRAGIREIARRWLWARKIAVDREELEGMRVFAYLAADKIGRARREGRSRWRHPDAAWVHLFHQYLAMKAVSRRKKKWWRRFLDSAGGLIHALRAV